MNSTIDALLRNQLLRTVLALCRLASHTNADDVREDVLGECGNALELWVAVPPDDRLGHLRQWCDSIAALLERCRAQSGVDQAALGRAQVLMLRLRAQLPRDESAVSASTDDDTDTAKPVESKVQVLEAITSAKEMRARDLLEHFDGQIAPRTVKRALAELAAEGLIIRIEHENHAVSYRSAP